MKKLTLREIEIIELLTKGLTNKEIAEKLSISTHTVKGILEKIYDKLNIHNRLLAGIYYYKHNQEKF